jgi:hypothetical protein
MDVATTVTSPSPFPKDWPTIRATIDEDRSPKVWIPAIDIVLRGRLNRLYFDPIHRLTRKHGEPGQGEGFSILTIQCSVLEFLAALRKGWSFKHGHKVQGTENYYGNSKLLYTSFLREEAPFAKSFTTAERANHFYTDIRCGLVHEGQTKNSWRIWRGKPSDPLIDFDRKAIHRDVMQRHIEAYLDRYCRELTLSVDLQQAFIRKFDHLYQNTAAPRPGESSTSQLTRRVSGASSLPSISK